jgi:hypothetical protein
MNEFEYAMETETAKLDLVQIQLWPPSQGHQDAKFALWSDLRFDEQPLPIEGWHVVVHLERAELAVQLTGCVIEKGTIFGDDPLPASEVIIESEIREAETKGTGKVSGAVGGSLTKGVYARGELSGNAEALLQTKKSHKREGRLLRRRVTSLPHDRWEIVEPSGRLKGTYLRAPADSENASQVNASAQGPLCHIAIVADSFTIRANVKATSEDIIPEIWPLQPSHAIWNTKSKPNKAAIVKLLLTSAHGERASLSDDKKMARQAKLTLAGCSLSGYRSGSMPANDLVQ